MGVITILVTSAGRRCELIELLRADAVELGLSPRIIAADLRPDWSSACQIADKSYRVPPVNQPDYADAIESIVRDENCQVLIPTIDTELQSIADARDRWEQMFPGLIVASHDPNFIRLCRDKAATMALLGSIGVDVPTTFASPGNPALDVSSASWPLIAKPVSGSSSNGVRDVVDPRDFESAASDGRTMIQEKLVGPEYTVNVYVTRERRVAGIVPHRRIATRGGEVEKGVVERLPGIEDVVNRIVTSQPGIRGPFNLQGMVRKNGSFAVFEVNGRFGGGFPLAHQAGGTFTRWVIQEGVLGQTVQAANIEFGWRMMRFDRSVFVKHDA